MPSEHTILKSMHRLFFSALALGTAVMPASAAPSLGLAENIISETAKTGSFQLVRNNQAAPIFADKSDWAGVLRAAGDLQSDVERVTGAKPALVTDRAPAGKYAVIAGTLGKSPLIDGLVKSGKIKTDEIAGKWESFIITTVANPMPGVDQALVLAGSDKRGTIYGIYEISEQIGVSPWYWFADVPAQHHNSLFIMPGTHVQGPPAVKYRGIFLNDEAPALTGWAHEKFGGLNSKMYTHIFELLLRLRANYMWPAMWGNAFNEDDPENPRLANEYGIVMGTSHHEPLMRAQKEWGNHRREMGNGQWNFVNNEAGLKKFWSEGIRRNRNYENLVTVGMRGDGDMAMPTTGNLQGDIKLLEKIIADQRQIIATEMNTDATKVPQLWALFTEVQKFYDNGMKVPDDVTLLFCDDNVGNLRRVPTPEERKRPGGSGIYFHMDMNGGPFSYKWLNSNPLPKIWEQMNLAHEYGANQIWIANVGDLKPLEIPIEFFIRMAWKPEAMPKEKIAEYQVRWAEREFGKEHAAEIADIAAKYAKYNGWRKPELLRTDTFSLVNFREAERMESLWNDIVARAEKINEDLPTEKRDAFYQLVLHPTKACATMVRMHIAAGRNQLYLMQKRASANDEATRTRELFAMDQKLGDYYNKTLAGGKWDHMMDQIHMGYTQWSTPRTTVMPQVSDLILPDTADFGVAIEGETGAWPGLKPGEQPNVKPTPQPAEQPGAQPGRRPGMRPGEQPGGRPGMQPGRRPGGQPSGQPRRQPGVFSGKLPPMDSINRQRSYVEVFPMGTRSIHFTAKADQPWIKLSEDKVPNAGKHDRRVWVDIDWAKAPAGTVTGKVTIKGAKASVDVMVTAIKATAEQVREAEGAWGGLTGPIAIAPQDAVKNIEAGGVRWEKIPDYGNVAAGMEVFPVTAASITPPAPAPRLEYPVYFAQPGQYSVDVVTGPTLNMLPGRNLGLAVSIDDQQQPQVIYLFPPDTGKDENFLGRNHGLNAGNNSRTMRFTQKVDAPGKHTLKVTMVDATVVLQKIMIHDKPLPPSYFGPIEGKPNGVAK